MEESRKVIKVEELIVISMMLHFRWVDEHTIYLLTKLTDAGNKSLIDIEIYRVII